ncbi:MAG: serine hydrolase domain-containing protein [Gemmatimonadota bacterium]|jgi:CubicO group peptidase (beta-lactamase class C family)
MNRLFRNPTAPRRAGATLLLAVALLPFTPLASAAQASAAAGSLGFSRARLARIDSVMQAYVDQQRMAGVVGLVLRRGAVVWQGAFGWADREAGRHMTTDALFRIASQTKALTSAGVMMLVEEGRIAITDPVSRYLPAFARTTVAVRSDSGRAIVPARRAITIRDLLTHTAGISYGTGALVADLYEPAGLGPAAGWGWYFADKAEPVCTTIERLATLPFVAQPGERFVYGYNTDILGCLIERVSGTSLDAFLRTRLFEPLGMRDTYFFVPDSKRDRLTAVYAAANGRLERAPDGPRGQGDYLHGPRTSFSGGAGAVSTAADYARFLEMMRNGGELDGVRVLGRKTVELMTADQLGDVYANPGRGFGLGFEILENPGLAGVYGTAGSYGWGGAYHSAYRVDPAEDLVIVLLTQTLPAGGLDMTSKFYTMVYQAITD